MVGKVIDFEKIVKGFTEMQDQNNQYLEAVSRLQLNMIAINNIELPSEAAFRHAPDDYNAIQQCLADVKKECTNFSVKIYTQLEAYPDQCLDALKTIDSCIEMALDDVTQLQEEGISDDRKKMLMDLLSKDLQNIIDRAGIQKDLLNGLLNALDKYLNENIINMYKNLDKIVSKLSSDTNEYKAAVAQLKIAKKDLEDEITNLKKTAIGAFGGMCVAMVIGVLSFAAALTTGGAALPVVAGAAIIIFPLLGGSATTIYASEKMQADQKLLEQMIENIKDDEADILVLENARDECNKYKLNVLGIMNCLKQINKAWSTVHDGFTYIYNQIDKLKIGDEKWKEISLCLINAESKSKEMQIMLTDMKISDTKVSTGNFVVTMDSDEVQRTDKSAERISFMEYMLAI